MAGNHHVAGLGRHFAGRAPGGLAGSMFDPAAEAYRVAHAAAREFPGGAVLQPRVRVFDLTAVLDLLREHAVFIADAVAERRQAERGHRIEETRRQPPQAAVAQGGVGFQVGHVFEALRVRRHAALGGLRQVQRAERIAQRAADQKFHRQVIDPARFGGSLQRLRRDPAPRQLLARDLRNGLHQLGRARLGGVDAHGLQQVLLDRCCNGRRSLGGNKAHRAFPFRCLGPSARGASGRSSILRARNVQPDFGCSGLAARPWRAA